MTFDPELLDLMPEEFSVVRGTVADKYGDNQPGDTDGPFRCQIARKTKRVRDASGNEVVSSTQIRTGGVFDVKVTDQVVIPGEADPVAILAVDQLPDEDGPHHEVIYLA